MKCKYKEQIIDKYPIRNLIALLFHVHDCDTIKYEALGYVAVCSYISS